jgi:hypothetical protein
MENNRSASAQLLADLQAANRLFLAAGNTAEQWLSLSHAHLEQWLQLARRAA